jgi:hypothetical protein
MCLMVNGGCHELIEVPNPHSSLQAGVYCLNVAGPPAQITCDVRRKLFLENHGYIAAFKDRENGTDRANRAELSGRNLQGSMGTTKTHATDGRAGQLIGPP